MAKATAKVAAPKNTPTDSGGETLTDPVARSKEDVVHWCYDNDHVDGVFCTLTFKDGSVATGTATSTGNLADDQAAASANALSTV